MEIRSIYLAGKIAKNDWRHTLIPSLRGAVEPEELDQCMRDDGASILSIDSWPILSDAILGKYDYTGPFFIACDHGCYHGPDSHGNAVRSIAVAQAHVMELCLRAIDKADLVFAWIDDPTCYGTLAEIGYAIGKGKHVFIAGPTKLKDLWFSYALADRISFEHSNPVEALKDLISNYENLEAFRNLYFSLSPIEQSFWSCWGNAYDIELKAQHEILGGKYRLDFAHLPTMTAIELDGLEAHSSTEQIANDRIRQREIEALGWRFIRFGGKEIYHDVEKCVSETYAFIQKALDTNRG